MAIDLKSILVEQQASPFLSAEHQGGVRAFNKGACGPIKEIYHHRSWTRE